MAANRIDGLDVDKVVGRFTGDFELEPFEAENLTADATIVAVVVARVNAVSFAVNKKTGEVKRVNGLTVSGFGVVDDPGLRETLFQHLAQQEYAVADLRDHQRAVVPLEPAPTAIVPAHDGPELHVSDDVLLDDSELIVAEEEVFSPGGPATARVKVGNSKDPILARFKESGI